MKAKKFICLALATLGLAALFTACGKTGENELQGGDDTTQQGTQGGTQQDGSQGNQQDKDDKEEQQKPNSGSQGGNDKEEQQKPNSGSQGGNDKEEQQKPGSDSQGSQGEDSDSQGGGEAEPEKHEHSFTYRTVKDATCLEDGEEEGVCSCGETTKRVITRLGHSFGEVQSDSVGQYRICTRCKYRDDIGEVMEFSVNIVVEEGSDFTLDEKTQILVYKNSSVYKIFDAQEHTTFSLPRGKYIVRADGFSDMYQQKGYYEISEDMPSVDIVVGNNPEYDRQITGMVHEGDKMFNFLVKDTTKAPEEYQRFYDIAKGKKLIFIDFFYVACIPCENLLKEELAFYKTLDEATKDDFLMIMIDTNSQDTVENINGHRERMGIPDEIITMRRGGQVYNNFENGGTVPHGGFLDENLNIIEITRGSDFKEMIQKHLQGKDPAKTVSMSIPEGEEPRRWQQKRKFIV